MNIVMFPKHKNRFLLQHKYRLKKKRKKKYPNIEMAPLFILLLLLFCLKPNGMNLTIEFVSWIWIDFVPLKRDYFRITHIHYLIESQRRFNIIILVGPLRYQQASTRARVVFIIMQFSLTFIYFYLIF
jgi:hypothetical protein